MYDARKFVFCAELMPREFFTDRPQSDTFSLIADTDTTLQQQFGVWAEKKLYGRSYMGTLRTTFIIDEDGIVTNIIGPKEVKTKDHANQILNL